MLKDLRVATCNTPILYDKSSIIKLSNIPLLLQKRKFYQLWNTCGPPKKYYLYDHFHLDHSFVHQTFKYVSIPKYVPELFVNFPCRNQNKFRKTIYLVSWKINMNTIFCLSENTV